MNRATSPATEDDSDGDNGYDYDPAIPLSSIENSKTIQLSLRASYTNWEPREAFRELVQNWRDGIIKSFNLAESDFRVVRKESITSRLGGDTDIVYKVTPFNHGSDAIDSVAEDDWLGFMRFTANHDEGVVEITNRAATLQTSHLDLGGTSKTDDASQAGAHGEGLKVALLVLMRGGQNHAVRCCSGQFNWHFNFSTSGRLVARLDRMSHQAISKAKSKARLSMGKTLLPFMPRPRKDVQFVIGERGKGRDQNGTMVTRHPVKRSEFDAWTHAALFLHPTGQNGEGIISTINGDLLTDREFSGRIYLKGLLLLESTPTRSASITNLPLKFGYNFASGLTNRERQSLAGAKEEANAILAIWSKVLVSKPKMVSGLSSMLNSADPQSADVFRAKDHMGYDTAIKLRDYLIEEFDGKWYYSSEEKSENSRLDRIIEGLGCKGVELEDDYWVIFKWHGLLRTAEEEEQDRFEAAPFVSTITSSFGKSVDHLLRACLRGCPQTYGKEPDFVRAGPLDLELLYLRTSQRLLVHERWLSLDLAVTQLGFSDNVSEQDIVFHSVRTLFADALGQFPLTSFSNLGDKARTPEWHRRSALNRAEQRLVDYLRMGELVITPVLYIKGLRVKWQLDSQRSQALRVQIQCHSASFCSDKRKTMLTANDVRSIKACGAYCTAGSVVDFERGTLQGEYTQRDLISGFRYFFTVVYPEDPNSIVRLSDVMTCPLLAIAPTPEPTGPGPFKLGSKLDDMRAIFKVDEDSWYEGNDDNGGKAVVGILSDNKAKGGKKTTKRRKLN